jgi:plastocyanin
VVKNRRVLLCIGFAATLALPVLAADDKEKGKWGTIKGQVVWAEDKLPEPEKIDVGAANPKECLKNGDLFSEKFVIDKGSKGVRWVVVSLVDSKDPNAALPIHPDLKALKDKKVVMDQPCCAFEPRVLCVRQGQTVVFKNSSEIPHGVNVLGTFNNPKLNKVVPPGTELEVDKWVAYWAPIPIRCESHKWMQGYVKVFNHPYYAVTDKDGSFEIKDAPAGEYNIVVWHETGFLLGDKTKTGVKITIKAGDTTDLGKIKMPMPKEDK